MLILLSFAIRLGALGETRTRTTLLRRQTLILLSFESLESRAGVEPAFAVLQTASFPEDRDIGARTRSRTETCELEARHAGR